MDPRSVETTGTRGVCRGVSRQAWGLGAGKTRVRFGVDVRIYVSGIPAAVVRESETQGGRIRSRLTASGLGHRHGYYSCQKTT